MILLTLLGNPAFPDFQLQTSAYAGAFSVRSQRLWSSRVWRNRIPLQKRSKIVGGSPRKEPKAPGMSF